MEFHWKSNPNGSRSPQFVVLTIAISIIAILLCTPFYAHSQMGKSPYGGAPPTKTTTTVGTPGIDTQVPTEKAVRDALTAQQDDNDTAMTRTGTGSASKWPTVRAVIAWAKGLFTQKLNNLSDLGNATAGRRNLALGSVATINLDGNATRALRGDGTFGAVSNTSTDTLATVTARGASPTGPIQGIDGGGSASGNLTLRGGNGAAGAGGNLILQAGTSTSGSQGMLQMVDAWKGTATVNQAVCSSATSETVANCAAGAMANLIGIAQTATTPIQVVTTGTALVVSDNNATVGDKICLSTTVAGQGHDQGSIPCTPGTRLGIVKSITEGGSAVRLPLVALAPLGLTVGQSFANITTVTTTPYTVASTDNYIRCDCQSGTPGNRVINLPAATGTGREITIKKIDASSTYTCTPTASGAETIDGYTSITMSKQWAATKLIDAAAGVWARSHVNELTGDVTGTNVLTTVGKINGVALSGLATGPLAVTTTTGVPRAGTGHDISMVRLCTATDGNTTVTKCTASPAFTPVAGDSVMYSSVAANTGAFQANVNSAGNKPVVKRGAIPLIAGDIRVAPFFVMLTYDGTSWEMEGQGGHAVPYLDVANTFTAAQEATSWAGTKVNGVASQSLYYSSHTTDVTGAGWQGPTSASGMAFSYYLIMPEAEPTAGQMMVFGTPTGHLATGSWATPATMTGVVLANGTIPLTADYDVGNFAITGKKFTSKKVTSTPSQSLLYSSYSTDVTGAGWQGPTSAAGMANSYFVTMPEAEPTAGQVIAAGTPVGHIAPGSWLTLGEILLTTVNLPLNADGNNTIYTVPAGKRCVMTKAILVAGAAAGGSTVTIGQAGALTDFLGTQTLSNLAAQYDTVILQPVPNATPVLIKSYAAGTVIKAVVGSQAGGATNSLNLMGLLY